MLYHILKVIDTIIIKYYYYKQNCQWTVNVAHGFMCAWLFVYLFNLYIAKLTNTLRVVCNHKTKNCN